MMTELLIQCATLTVGVAFCWTAAMMRIDQKARQTRHAGGVRCLPIHNCPGCDIAAHCE